MDEKKIPTLKDFVELEIRVPVMTVLLCLGHIRLDLVSLRYLECDHQHTFL